MTVQTPERKANIQEAIQTAIQEAHQACEQFGPNSTACANAWDTVEELQAEASHQKSKRNPRASFEAYCDQHPDADECRVYDV